MASRIGMSTLTVLVVGGGGREHALAWKLSKSSLVSEIFVAPGNGGTEIEESIQNIAIDSNDIEGLSNFAKKSGIDLTIVGPEDPLVNGITDKFQDEGLLCFGPSKDAARLEGSKEFMKDFLLRNKIPTASYKTFTDAEKAINSLTQTIQLEVEKLREIGRDNTKETLFLLDLVGQLKQFEGVCQESSDKKVGQHLVELLERHHAYLTSLLKEKFSSMGKMAVKEFNTMAMNINTQKAEIKRIMTAPPSDMAPEAQQRPKSTPHSE
mgnify:CR=1 FL=1